MVLFKKNETTHFNADIEKNAAFKSFMCKTKLIAKTEAQTTPDNKYRFLKNAAILVSLKYLIKFLEIPWNVTDWLQSWMKT